MTPQKLWASRLKKKISGQVRSSKKVNIFLKEFTPIQESVKIMDVHLSQSPFLNTTWDHMISVPSFFLGLAVIISTVQCSCAHMLVHTRTHTHTHLAQLWVPFQWGRSTARSLAWSCAALLPHLPLSRGRQGGARGCNFGCY